MSSKWVVTTLKLLNVDIYWNKTKSLFQVITVSWMHLQAAAFQVCAETEACVSTDRRVGSCASVHRGSTRSPTVRWPPAASPVSPSSPSEAWGRDSTSPSPSCEFFLLPLRLFIPCIFVFFSSSSVTKPQTVKWVLFNNWDWIKLKTTTTDCTCHSLHFSSCCTTIAEKVLSS